ncbi:hypothetical protein FB45DRAFT_930595 [Roridomyces roridus]|uniref:VWFA domain-containing protein n=1 Tax=Roridomyces roridus TaxID=1738132 RepID=A0AAD7BFB0_9AGAR|nr:hypothetical protein FB45DRAFT_930595 [Roridomyces roridus]
MPNDFKTPNSFNPVEPDASQGRSLLSLPGFLGRGRSRSTDEAPPAYEAVVGKPTLSRKWNLFGSSKGGTQCGATISGQKEARMVSAENALEILRKFDTVILMDDSPSMKKSGSNNQVSRWTEAGLALQSLAEKVVQYDEDGMDIHFLNHKESALQLKSASNVKEVFDKVTPRGWTPTGRRLRDLLTPLLDQLEAANIEPDGTPKNKETRKEIKRVNIIVVTDGEASDDPKQTIIEAATRLTNLRNLCMIQVGIQFVQIGSDPGATQALKQLDDDLEKAHNIRDIVDTTPYSELHPVTAEALIKVLCGGVNRRVDEQKNKK